MIGWPSWLWIGTPIKFSVWLVNRLATWTGSFYLWKRIRSKPHFWPSFLLLNLLSLATLCLVLFWLHVRSSQ